MQNKKPMLQRMLAIYVIFFAVLATGLAHSVWPNFSKGYDEGAVIGRDIARNWASGAPRSIFTLFEVPLSAKTPVRLDGADSLAGIRLVPTPRRIDLAADLPADAGSSPLHLALSSIGGNPWFYLITVFRALAFVAIVVLMFLIIHSIRRSIREEHTLDRRNVWYLRAIGSLTILTELLNDVMTWRMSVRAAELLAPYGEAIDTAFHVSYANIILGILVLFTAEVCAIGQNLSEEQKFTI